MDDRHLKDILGSAGSRLAGRRIVLGISGSIAAVESVRLARDLMRQGAEVRAVLTPAARRLVSPRALRWATGNPVIRRLTGRVEHLELLGDEGSCDALLVAPATAATLAKMALALDDTAVSTMATTALGSGRPILVAPGMHDCMYRHPVVLRHLAALEDLGVVVIPPRFEEGKAKIAAPEDILEAVARVFGPRDLQARTVLVTAGSTREPLDPVRFLSNRSSGRMGIELAREARRRGAQVALVLGPSAETPPAGVRVLRVETAAQMAEAVARELQDRFVDLFVGAAAVADFQLSEPQAQKIPTRAGELELRLRPTPKILHRVRDLSPETRVVGFKAETGSLDDLLTAARRLRVEARADLVLANPVGVAGQGFDADHNEIWAVGEGEPHHLGLHRKSDLARLVWDLLARL